MEDNLQHYLQVEIDELTNSIQNTVTGAQLATEVQAFGKADLKIVTKTNGWKFDWKAELAEQDRSVYKLVIQQSPETIQGLVSMSDYGDHFYLHLVESAPFNLGDKKSYVGVPGNLFAFACKCSFDARYEGFVAFQAKTKLIQHYEVTLGAVHIGGQKMILFPQAALQLIQKYF